MDLNQKKGERPRMLKNRFSRAVILSTSTSILFLLDAAY